MLKRWKRLNTKIFSKNPWWTYKLDTFEIPNEYTGEYHYVYTNGSSMVIPVRDDGKVILVKQYRYLCERDSIEFPCGSVKDGDGYDDTAHHELGEETGFDARSMERIGQFAPYNGVSSEICRVYIARDLTLSEAQPDHTEEFELIFCSAKEIEDLITANEIWDGMTLAAWSFGRSAL